MALFDRGHPARGNMSDKPEKPTRVLFVRHALNDWVGKRLAGWTPGVHLNERGLAQAAALGERLANATIAAIYSSPLERAQETAAAIAAHHPGLAVATVDGLGESRIGDWTGKSLEDLGKTDLWRQVQFAPSMFRFPNGESMAETQTRFITAVDRVRAAHPGETIVVVAHSDPIKLAVAFYLGMPLDLFQRMAISPASITEFAFSPFGGHLLRCNDTAHLPPEPEPEPEPEEKAAGDEAAAESASPVTAGAGVASNATTGEGTGERSAPSDYSGEAQRQQ